MDTDSASARVRKSSGASGWLGSVGDYGRAGANGTYFWIDPKEQLICIILMMTQVGRLRTEFPNEVEGRNSSRFPSRSFPSAVRRRDLPGCDLVLEGVRIEAVEPAVGCFRLRIHEEAERRTGRCWQRDIVREVIRHPIHLPGAE